MPRRLALTDDERAELLRRYIAEGDAAALAREYGLGSRRQVYRLAFKRGARAPRNRPRVSVSPERATALARYAAGGNSELIAAELGMTRGALRALASRARVRSPGRAALEPPRRCHHPTSADAEREVVEG